MYAVYGLFSYYAHASHIYNFVVAQYLKKCQNSRAFRRKRKKQSNFLLFSVFYIVHLLYLDFRQKIKILRILNLILRSCASFEILKYCVKTQDPASPSNPAPCAHRCTEPTANSCLGRKLSHMVAPQRPQAGANFKVI